MRPGPSRKFRVPQSEIKKSLKIPFFLSRVHCGFPNPATDYLENVLSLDELCIYHQDSTYFVRVEGCSMINFQLVLNSQVINSRIDDGDILIVDTVITPVDGQVVVAFDGDGYVVRRLKRIDEMLILHADNPAYQPIYMHPEFDDSFIFGTVTWVLFKPAILP